MKTAYRFEPQSDLTALELAEIVEVPEISAEVYDRLPERIRRHFAPKTALTIFGRPVIEASGQSVKTGDIVVGTDFTKATKMQKVKTPAPIKGKYSEGKGVIVSTTAKPSRRTRKA